MKLTKTQLKQIIKEEIDNSDQGDFDQIKSEILMLASSLQKGSMSMSEDELEFAIADLIDSAIYEVGKMMTPLLRDLDAVTFGGALLRAIQDENLQSWKEL